MDVVVLLKAKDILLVRQMAITLEVSLPTLPPLPTVMAMKAPTARVVPQEDGADVAPELMLEAQVRGVLVKLATPLPPDQLPLQFFEDGPSTKHGKLGAEARTECEQAKVARQKVR